MQNPWSSMNPKMRIKEVIAEPLIVNNVNKLSKIEIYDRVNEMLELVGLTKDQANRFPHEFSGGQRQRIVVARALVINPSIVILDEPVSALDVSIRAQIMNLLKDLQEKYNLCYLMIAHNMATVRYMTHSVAIMYLGQIVESGESEEIFQNPLHPYTKALMSASQLQLSEDDDNRSDQIVLGGEMPSPLNPPSGCRFHTRCTECKDTCSTLVPVMNSVGNHLVRCNRFN
jgi:oligopeptide/dipeptide ABC transporter ATP-binding protein